jgi:hypothetical protein
MSLFHRHNWRTVEQYHGTQIITGAEMTLWLQQCTVCPKRRRLQEYGLWPLTQRNQ